MEQGMKVFLGIRVARVGRIFCAFSAAVVAIAATVAFGAEEASARYLSVAAVGGVAQSLPSNNSATASFGADEGLAYGALVELRRGRFFSLEAGALSLQRRFNVSYPGITPGVESRLKLKYYEFPVALRFSLLRFLSVGAGVYRAIARGDVSVETVSSGSSSTATTSYDAQALKKREWGWLASVRLQRSFTRLFALFLDARMTRTIGDASTDSSGFQHKDLQALAGFSVGI